MEGCDLPTVGRFFLFNSQTVIGLLLSVSHNPLGWSSPPGWSERLWPRDYLETDVTWSYALTVGTVPGSAGSAGSAGTHLGERGRIQSSAGRGNENCLCYAPVARPRDRDGAAHAGREFSQTALWR